MPTTLELVQSLKDAGQDFEWYPTTRKMVEAVRGYLPRDVDSFMDIGAGDGRVLKMFAESYPNAPLYAIELSTILQQQQPEEVIPVGTDFWEQDLMSLPVDVLFCNPPYSDFEAWASRIIDTANAKVLYLVVPQRWETSEAILASLKKREAKARVIHRDDFHDAERQARAVVHIVQVTISESRYDRDDPFDRWFDQNISTFDEEKEASDYQQEQQALSRLHKLDSINSLVAAFDEEYARMQENYTAIFRLDYALLKELGVNKANVREGLKKRMQGLKHTYWTALFQHLDVVTSRLTNKTKKIFLDRLNGRTAVAFTASNAYAVVLWAIKYANQYFDSQVVDVFRQLSTHDGVLNYKSNQRTWAKDGWRYNAEQFDHYALDYRVVLDHYQAIHDTRKDSFGGYNYPGKLHTSCHEVIDDLIAVFGNLGFLVRDVSSRTRGWESNTWQDFRMADGRVLFQVKGFLNGNLHFRFLPDAIKALNIEAGRLLGWIRSPADVVAELGYTVKDAEKFFGSNARLGTSSIKLLAAAPAA